MKTEKIDARRVRKTGPSGRYKTPSWRGYGGGRFVLCDEICCKALTGNDLVLGYP
jgi:hypothetical protein